MKHPELTPAFHWLHREHQRRTLRNRLRGGHPHDPVSATPHEGCQAAPTRVLQGDTRLPRSTRGGAEGQRPRLGRRLHRGPADRAYPKHRIDVLGPTVVTEIARMNGDQLGKCTLGCRLRRLEAPSLLEGNRCPYLGAPGVNPAPRHRAQILLVDLVQQPAAVTL